MKEFFLSRIAQLLSRYVGMFLVSAGAWSGTAVSPEQAESAGGTLAMIIIGALFMGYDLVAHKIKHGEWLGALKAPGKLPMLLLACLGLSFAAGCATKPPPEVLEARDFKRKSIQAYAESNDEILDAILAAYRAEAYEHLETKIRGDIATATRNAAASNGQVKIEDAIKFMQQVEGDRSTGRARIDAAVAQIRVAMAQARVNLAIGLKVDEALSEYENAGVDMSAARKAVDEIMALVGQLTKKP